MGVTQIPKTTVLNVSPRLQSLPNAVSRSVLPKQTETSHKSFKNYTSALQEVHRFDDAQPRDEFKYNSLQFQQLAQGHPIARAKAPRY